MVSPSGRRVVAEHFQEDFELSERRAADLAQVGRSTLRYRSRRAADNDVRDRLRALATERPRFGYRRQRVLIQREGLEINHRRVFSLYRDEGLTMIIGSDANDGRMHRASDWRSPSSRTTCGRWTSSATRSSPAAAYGC